MSGEMIAFCVSNVVWFVLASWMNNSWRDHCLKINEEWYQLCMKYINEDRDKD
jgi:hypothetical protein